MTTDEYAREQRLRKQAELQSLYTNLASLRERESSYIQFSTAIPELLENQITEARYQIEETEGELLTLGDETVGTPARQFYRDAFQAELGEDFAEAIKLYKSALRYTHPDAGAALRSLRYKIKAESGQGADKAWASLSGGSSSRFWIGLVILLIVALIAIFAFRGRFNSPAPPVVAVEPTATPTSSEAIVIIPNTATPTPTNTPTSTLTPTPTDTPPPTPTEELPAETPTLTPTLKAAPKIIGPENGLVWKDGAVVFEFEDFDLPYNELYCLNSMRGYDETNTENWSHPAIGSKNPAIPIYASVFRIAKIQGIQCVVWSASIGVDSCDNIISESTAERVIGLPQVCDFD